MKDFSAEGELLGFYAVFLSGFWRLVIISCGRRTQVAKGAVCKTAIQRFDPARRLHFPFTLWKVRA